MMKIEFRPSELVIREFSDGTEYVALRQAKEAVKECREAGVVDHVPYEERDAGEDAGEATEEESED